jgi:hypothetical protein
MGTRIEWVHATEERPEVVSPEMIEELADAGNDAGDWGIGAGGVMIYGDPGQLEGWLTAVKADLAEPLRKFRNKQAAQTRKDAGLPKCKHTWMLTEDGYGRCWSTTVDKKAKVIRAFFDGTSDFTENGEGEYLQCTECGHVKLLPVDWEVEYS